LERAVEGSRDDAYWLRQPYAVLFDLLRLQRVKPWDVSLSPLLDGLMREMKQRGFIDFSVSGTALLSSAILLRMKSELVLKMEEPPRPPVERPTDYVPPPLAFPLRYEATTTSLDMVLKELLEVLKVERSLPQTLEQLAARTPEVFEQMDDFQRHIEEHIEALYKRLALEAGKTRGAKLSFLGLLIKRTVLEAVQLFLMLLFLTVQGRVGLYQSEEFADIMIELKTDHHPGSVPEKNPSAE
jgi:segregation and condensation protein A